MPYYTIHIWDDVFYVGVEAESKDVAAAKAWQWFNERVPNVEVEEDVEENEDE